MAIDGYLKLHEDATKGGAPIDAYTLDGMRRNDDAFHAAIQAALASPFAAHGGDNDVTLNAAANGRRIYNAKNITLTSTITLDDELPLIWFARKTITIGNGGKIEARGKGARPNQDGDFGGSGGGAAATNAGKDCKLPVRGTTIVTGGAINTVGAQISEEWASRFLQYLPFAKGGAGGGGGTAGAGGGIVILCAQEIKFVGNGEIDARGADGSGGNHGGGGGGLIVLIAGTIDNDQEDDTPTPAAAKNVLYGGGQGDGTGKAGGKGRYLRFIAT